MAKITKVSAQQRNNSSRVNIFVDGEFYCAVEKITALAFGLKEGREVDEQRLSQIIRDSEQKNAFDCAIRYITRRMRAKSEIYRYLLEKEYSLMTVNLTLDKLEEYGYVNDEEFARAYVKNYRNRFGNKKLVYELERLNIDRGVIDSALDCEEDSEENAARLVAQKYLRTHKGERLEAKLTAYLYSKGFEIERARQTAKQLINQSED